MMGETVWQGRSGNYVPLNILPETVNGIIFRQIITDMIEGGVTSKPIVEDKFGDLAIPMGITDVLNLKDYIKSEYLIFKSANAQEFVCKDIMIGIGYSTS
jgi:hypothetical protein